MKEWIEELLAEKAAMQQQLELLTRIVAYLDTDRNDDDPIELKYILELTPPQISVDQEGVHLHYVDTL